MTYMFGLYSLSLPHPLPPSHSLSTTHHTHTHTHTHAHIPEIFTEKILYAGYFSRFWKYGNEQNRSRACPQETSILIQPMF